MYEKGKDEPFIDVNFFRNNLNITLIFGQYILSTVIFFAVSLSFQLFLQSVIGTTSGMAGIVMLALSLLAMVMTPIATRWMERTGFRLPLFVSVLIGLLGVGLMLLMLFVKEDSGLFFIGFVLSVLGICNGIQNIGLQNLLYASIDKEDSGIASGLLMTSRFVGNVLASSMYGIAFASGMNDGSMMNLTMMLFVVVVLLAPGMLYVTKGK